MNITTTPTTLRSAINIALAHYLVRYICPLRALVPTLHCQLQQVYLRHTLQNHHCLHHLLSASEADCQQFLVASLTPLPQELTHHQPTLHIVLSELPHPQRQITVLVRKEGKLIEFDFYFQGELAVTTSE